MGLRGLWGLRGVRGGRGQGMVWIGVLMAF